MASVLLTAFEPFGGWPTNSSALCLERLLAMGLPAGLDVTPRLYPVDFAATRRELLFDLERGFHYSLHLGQAGSCGEIRLERTARNLGVDPLSSEPLVLEPNGPAAVQCALPLAAWSETLVAQGHPVVVSDDAGTYLCNATLYWSLRAAQTQGLATRSMFVHLPLDESQSDGATESTQFYPAQQAAQAVGTLLEQLSEFDRRI